MKIYEFLARRNWPRTYNAKILLVSFIGVHVPMFGAVSYVLIGDETPFIQQIDVLVAMLIATLTGTAGTMFVMHALLSPVHAATRAVDGYLRDRKTPRLPTRFDDEAGVLMASIQECITRLDGALTTTELQRQQLELDHAAKFKMLSGMKHDFRTPLTHILGFAELMKAESIGPLGSDAYRKFADKIGTSGQDLLQTLQSVLDLSDAETSGQFAEDSAHFDAAELARQAVSLEHLHAEKSGVAVALDAPRTMDLHTVPSVVKNLLGSMLHAGISRTPEGGSVRMVLDGGDPDTFTVEATGGQLCLEDVPAEMTRFFDKLESGAGATSGSPETSTPMTLRISLIDTLCRAIGAGFSLAQTGEKSFIMRVELPPPPAAMAIAAE